jgi:hypothetical protein
VGPSRSAVFGSVEFSASESESLDDDDDDEEVKSLESLLFEDSFLRKDLKN